STGIAFSGDNRFRIGTYEENRCARSSLSAPRPTAHIRPTESEMAADRAGRLSLRDIAREFTPNWFSATMGTGALALALNQIPVAIPGIHDLAGGIWLLDILLFVLFATLYAARWILFFDEARQIARHSVLSMFFGAIPMGLATIINGLVVFGGGRLE